MTNLNIVVEHTLSWEEALKRRVPFSQNLGLNLGWHQVTVAWHKDNDPAKADFVYEDSIKIRGTITIRDHAVVFIGESPHAAPLLVRIHAKIKTIIEQSFAPEFLPVTRLET